MAKQLADQSQGGFSGNTKENPKNETCKAIGLRSKKVLPPFVPPTPKNVDEIVVEDVEDGVVEKNYGEVLVEKENDHGVVENERKEKKY